MNANAALERIVVHKANRDNAFLRAAQQVAGGCFSGIARADNKRTLTGLGRHIGGGLSYSKQERAVGNLPVADADNRQQKQVRTPVDDLHSPRILALHTVAGQKQKGIKNNRRYTGRAPHNPQIVDRHIPPVDPVQPKRPQSRKANAN